MTKCVILYNIWDDSIFLQKQHDKMRLEIWIYQMDTFVWAFILF